MTDEDRVRLPVGGTLRAAFQEAVGARLPLARAIVLPAGFNALYFAVFWPLQSADRTDLSAFARRMMLASLAALLISALVATLIAVSCHRLVLVGEGSMAAKWGLYWSGREWRFLGRAIVIGALVALPTAIASGAVAIAYAHGATDRIWTHEIQIAMSVLFAYPTARLSLVLPATAIDEPLSFAQSWRLTSGNGWRLAVVLLVGPLLLEALRGVLGFFHPPEHAAFAGVRSFVFCVLGVFEIVTLSVSYRALRGQRAEPSHLVHDP